MNKIEQTSTEKDALRQREELSANSSHDEVVKAFATKLNRVVMEGRKAGDDGLEAMERIAAQIIGGDNGQAILMRSMLLSIFGKVKVDLSEIGRLDWDLRKDLCAVILGVNHGRFDDYKIREILIAAGDHKAAWFFAGVPADPIDNE